MGIENFNKILKSFRISANCVNYQKLNNSYFYDIQLSPGTRISKIDKYTTEIALALKSPIPTINVLSTEGIIRLQFVESIKKSSLFSLGQDSIRPSGKLTCLLGETLQGNHLWIDLAEAPHILLAGTTGSGKTTVLHTFIANLLLYPKISLSLIDPKNIEFSQYSNNKISCVSSYKESIDLLSYLNQEMESRFLSNKRDPHILIIDEYADLALQDKNKVFAGLLCKLAQKSRAVGVHIICATQRPSVNIIDGVIKANFPTRISCKVASAIDSKVILDATGAENLLGAGDAIIKSSQHNMLRFQTAFTSPEYIRKYL